MSSYLTFYLIPKKEKVKKQTPMTFISYSRSSEVYQAINETLNPAYCGTETKYSEVDAEDIKRVIASVEEDKAEAENRLKLRVEAYKEMANGVIPDEAIDEYVSLKGYIQDLQGTIHALEGIYSWISDLEYSDFEKVLMNVG